MVPDVLHPTGNFKDAANIFFSDLIHCLGTINLRHKISLLILTQIYFVGRTAENIKSCSPEIEISGRTALLSAVPPELLYPFVQSLLSVCRFNVRPTSHLLVICHMTFRLKLMKCYSHEFTLQGSHYSRSL